MESIIEILTNAGIDMFILHFVSVAIILISLLLMLFRGILIHLIILFISGLAISIITGTSISPDHFVNYVMGIL